MQKVLLPIISFKICKMIYTIQPNLGIGINIKGVEIEYALTDIGDVSIAEYSNIFSLKFNLNPKTN